MKYDIITIGGAVEDITFHTKEGVLIDNHKDILRQRLLAFEYGAKIKISSVHNTFGGGAANAAVAAARLGLKSACICAVGDDDRGKKIVANLEKEKVDTSFVQIIKGAESGFSFLIVGPEDEHIIFPYRAANSELNVPKNLLTGIESEWLYLTSLSGNWRKNLKTIFSFGEKFKIAWNPGNVQLSEGQSFIRKNLSQVKVFNINEDEATELVVSDKKVMRLRQENAAYLSNIHNLLTVIKSYSPQIAMITRGKKGADAYDGDEFYHANIHKEGKRINTTGVGDAFGSTFALGLKFFAGDIKKAMNFGMQNTASVISHQGAQEGLLKLEDIKKLL
jgi:sugar/nucleoside kinase (ribokinase family)